MNPDAYRYHTYVIEISNDVLFEAKFKKAKPGNG